MVWVLGDFAGLEEEIKRDWLLGSRKRRRGRERERVKKKKTKKKKEEMNSVCFNVKNKK